MSLTTSSERLAKAMAYVRRHWQAQRKCELAAPSPPLVRPAFTVAISRESGTGGTAIARALGAELNWPVYDKELVQQIAEQMGLRAELLDSVDERRRSWLQESLEAFASTPAVSASGFVRRLVETVLALGTHGECIIVGRGAPQILAAERTLRVRIVAPLEDRIARKAKILNISKREATRQIETIDEERTRFVESHFHRDSRDPSAYDLVLNSSRFCVDECAELIAAALKRLRAPGAKQEPALVT
jgi:cytidylate kinase